MPRTWRRETSYKVSTGRLFKFLLLIGLAVAIVGLIVAIIYLVKKRATDMRS